MKTYIVKNFVDAEPCNAWEESANYPIGSPGYKVEYREGYVSWYPKNVFERHYKLINHNMNFCDALNALKAGRKVARKGWNGKGIFIQLQKPDEDSLMSGDYIFIDTTRLFSDNQFSPKHRVPWQPSQTDMLSDDWGIVLDRYL